MAMKTYNVDASLKHPGCYHRGYEFTVNAKNKAEALKDARRQVSNLGHTRHDGPLIYKITEVEDV